jgi:hypothetical protein
MSTFIVLSIGLALLYGSCRALDRFGAFQGLMTFIVVACLWVFVLPLGAFVTLILAIMGFMPDPNSQAPKLTPSKPSGTANVRQTNATLSSPSGSSTRPSHAYAYVAFAAVSCAFFFASAMYLQTWTAKARRSSMSVALNEPMAVSQASIKYRACSE